MKANWAGVYPAVPTQFNADLSVNLEAIQKHLGILLEAGVHGLVMLGTIGENCSLSRGEKEAVLKATREVAGGKVPILSGVAEFTTQGACETARLAEDAGDLTTALRHYGNANQHGDFKDVAERYERLRQTLPGD